MYFYNARYYDSYLNRFIQADTIVPDPGNPQDLNRFSYVRNNPVRYTDPTGHCIFGIDTLVCLAAGGAIVGAAIGYGKQVYDNVQSGMDVKDALTTDIDAEPIVKGAFLGATIPVVGAYVATAFGVGGAATAAGGTATAACADGDCTNEIEGASRAIQRLPNFADIQKAVEHYAKHVKGVIFKNGESLTKPGGPDMPEFGSFGEYIDAARSFLSGPAADGVMQVIRASGDLVRFDPSTGYFGVLSSDQVIRTFFRPDGNEAQQLQYFLEQIR